MIALDSRAEILLGYSLLFWDRVLQLSGKRNPTVRDFMHYTGRGQLVIQDLQGRGVYRKEHTGTTLRGHLVMARPEVSVWRH